MTITEGKIKWIDIVKPTADDLTWLEKNYNLHKVILKELNTPSARSRVESYENHLYFIYYFPIYDEHEATSRSAEIDFVVTEDAVITVHYHHIPALDRFKTLNFETSLELTYQILETFFEFQERQLVHVGEKVEEAGKLLFKDREREVLTHISHLKRDVSEYRIIARRQGPILKSLLEEGGRFWGPKSKIYINSLIGDHLKISDQMEDYRQAISDFEDTNNQLINVKTTQVTKTFTILAFLTFPMMLLANLFSMNTKDTPIVENPHGFWIILSIMIIAMTGMYRYFKNKDWL